MRFRARPEPPAAKAVPGVLLLGKTSAAKESDATFESPVSIWSIVNLGQSETQSTQRYRAQGLNRGVGSASVFS